MNALPKKEAAPDDFWPSIIAFSLILAILHLDFHFAAWRSFAMTIPIALFYAATIFYRAIAGQAVISARIMRWVGLSFGVVLIAIGFATRSANTADVIYFFSRKPMSLPLAISSAAGLLVGLQLGDVVLDWIVHWCRAIRDHFRDRS